MKKKFLVIFFSFIAHYSYSQQLVKVFDSGIWSGVSLDYEFNKDFNFSIGQDIRLLENFTKISKADTDLGLEYTINKNFKLASNVRYSYNLRKADFYSHDLRLNYDLMFRIKLVKNLKLRYRLRFQQVFENLMTLKRYRYAGMESNLRNKLQFDYTIKEHRIYVYTELFREFKQNRKAYFNKTRVVIGNKWKHKWGELDYAIAYERELGVTHPLNYLFAKIYYTFNFKQKKKSKKERKGRKNEN